MDQKAAWQPRSRAREKAALPDTRHSSENLADWLQEVARRPWVDGPTSVNSATPPLAGAQAGREFRQRRYLPHGRDILALAALTAGFLQYYYLDVMVQIGGLHKVVIFVPLTAA